MGKTVGQIGLEERLNYFELEINQPIPDIAHSGYDMARKFAAMAAELVGYVQSLREEVEELRCSANEAAERFMDQLKDPQ